MCRSLFGDRLHHASVTRRLGITEFPNNQGPSHVSSATFFRIGSPCWPCREAVGRRDANVCSDPDRRAGVAFQPVAFCQDSVATLTAALSESVDPAGRYAAGESDAIKKAVQFLWGFSDEDGSRLPSLTGSVDDAVPGSIRVAVASTRGERIDEHFGIALRFFVYQVTTNRARLIDIRSIAAAVDAEDVNDFRVELLRDCQLLYVGSIGGPPAGKVVQRGIYPLKVSGQPAISEELGRLRSKMADQPPPWLAKAMGTPVEDRIRYTDVSRAESKHPRRITAMVKSKRELAELLNERACKHNHQDKVGCARTQPGATAGGCAFDGARSRCCPSPTWLTSFTDRSAARAAPGTTAAPGPRARSSTRSA